MIIFWSAIRSHLIERVCCCTREIIKKTKTNKDMPFVGCCISITGVGCHRQRVGISFAYSCRNCCECLVKSLLMCYFKRKRTNFIQVFNCFKKQELSYRGRNWFKNCIIINWSWETRKSTWIECYAENWIEHINKTAAHIEAKPKKLTLAKT